MLPHWKRRFRQFSSSRMGKAALWTVFLWSIVSGTLFRVQPPHSVSLLVMATANCVLLCIHLAVLCVPQPHLHAHCICPQAHMQTSIHNESGVCIVSAKDIRITLLCMHSDSIYIHADKSDAVTVVLQVMHIFFLLWWILPLIVIPFVRRNAAKAQQNMYGAAGPSGARGFGNPAAFTQQRRRRPDHREDQVIDAEWTTIDSDSERGRKHR